VTIQNGTPQKPQPPKRSMLGAVTRGPTQQPFRVLGFGPEGVGKSTFGAGAPAPIFLGTEDGTGQLDVARFPEPQSWDEALDAIRELVREPHKYGTLVIDTLDWLEPLVWRHVCARDRKANIEAYGYGKGYVAALDEWRVMLAELERLRRAKQMHVVLLAHSLVKTYKNPEGDDYDRYSLKIHEKAGGLLKEWCDAVLFANYKTHVLKDGARAKGYDGNTRVVHTERRAAWDAKNRFGLPLELPLDWAEFYAAVRANSGAEAAAAVRDEIARRLPLVPDAAKREAVEKWLAEAGSSVALLRAGLNKVNALIPTTSEKEPTE
jgi:hypothetical protein